MLAVAVCFGCGSDDPEDEFRERRNQVALGEDLAAHPLLAREFVNGVRIHDLGESQDLG